VCCARIRQRWWAQRLPIVGPCALVVAEPSEIAFAPGDTSRRHSAFTLHTLTRMFSSLYYRK